MRPSHLRTMVMTMIRIKKAMIMASRTSIQSMLKARTA